MIVIGAAASVALGILLPVALTILYLDLRARQSPQVLPAPPVSEAADSAGRYGLGRLA